MRNPELSVVLVNYNDSNHLQDCLSSLLNNSRGIDLEVIVVDNNSSDGSPELVKKKFPQVTLIRNSQNLGFSRANNQGIKKSRGEFVLFLNTDTVVFPGALECLLAEIRRDDMVGAVGPLLLRGENRYQVSFGGRVSFVFQVFQKCFLNPFYKLKLKVWRRKKSVRWLSAACLLVRRNVLQKAGLFDEKFFIYFEDIDLCFRIKKCGFKLLFIPEARVFHYGGGTAFNIGIISRFEYRKSQLYFYSKHNSRLSLFFLRLYLWWNIFILFNFGSLRKHRDSDLRRRYFELLKKPEK